MADTGLPPGSPAHQSSGSSTNPNTPRSATPDRTEPVNDDTAEVDSSSESAASSEARRYDIQPTWPKEIDITKSPALAAWEDRRLPNLLLDLHWHPKSNKAFFTLRTTVVFLKGSGRRDGKTSIYLFIHPERIRQLFIDPNPTERVLGVGTLMMRFDMDRAPALVLPKTPGEPKTRAARDVMGTLRTLARQTSFVIYADIPRSKLSAVRIRELCAAASGSGLASLDVHASTARLYQGQGGNIIEGDCLDGHAPDLPANDEPPPQYEGPSAAEPPPAPPGDGKGKKRRRPSDSPEPTEPASRKAMLALLDASLSTLKQHFEDRLDAHKKEVAELLDSTEARILDTLRGEMDELSGGMHQMLEERIEQEMAEVEDSVMRNITEAPLQASLTFPQHPWY